MVFKRQNRNIKFEFECIDGEVLKYETAHSAELANKLTAIGEIDYDKKNDEEVKEILIRAYDQILGENAMDDIKELVYGGDEFTMADIIDIGVYIIEQVNKANKELDKLFSAVQDVKSEKNE